MLLCGSCGDDTGHGVKVPEIDPHSDLEYAQAIDTLRDAWRERPREISEENGKAEQRFIARLSSFANHTKGTSNFKETTLLWREVITEHTRDYPGQK